MKKLAVLGMGVCVALAFSSCKSNESAYKKAYENAKKQELAEAPQPTETATVEDDFDFKEVFFSVLSALSAFVSFTVFLVSTGADPIKASSPRPNPFLATSNHLLRKFFITFCTGTFWVVFTDRKSMRRCF